MAAKKTRKLAKNTRKKAATRAAKTSRRAGSARKSAPARPKKKAAKAVAKKARASAKKAVRRAAPRVTKRAAAPKKKATARKAAPKKKVAAKPKRSAVRRAQKPAKKRVARAIVRKKAKVARKPARVAARRTARVAAKKAAKLKQLRAKPARPARAAKRVARPKKAVRVRPERAARRVERKKPVTSRAEARAAQKLEEAAEKEVSKKEAAKAKEVSKKEAAKAKEVSKKEKPAKEAPKAKEISKKEKPAKEAAKTKEAPSKEREREKPALALKEKPSKEKPSKEKPSKEKPSKEKPAGKDKPGKGKDLEGKIRLKGDKPREPRIMAVREPQPRVAALPLPMLPPPRRPTIEERSASIDQRLAAQSEDFRQRYEASFDMSWIYHDSALEGVVYTFEELRAALSGQAPPPVADTNLQPTYDDIRRHKEAIEFVRDYAKKKLPITIDVIKKIYLILHPEEGDIKTVKYRKDIPQHRLYFHEYAPPDKIAYKVRQIVDWLNDPETRKTRNALRIAARAHYDLLRVYPFQSDSGKVARLFMNLLLIRSGMHPSIIHSTERQRYYEALKGSATTVLQMVQESAENAMASVEKLLDEHETRKRAFVN
jgi:Fic family protein